MLPAAILSGGDSSRMGRPKALLAIPPTGERFLDRLTRTLRDAGVEDVLVVAGADASAIRAHLESVTPVVRLLVNPQPARGQLSSLHVALSAIDRPGVNGLIIALVDHPLVSAETVRRLIDTHEQTRAAIVRPVRGDQHGHPVLFDRRTFDALRHADPAVGAKEVVHAYAQQMVEVEVADEGVCTDIDTPEDYERVFGVKPEAVE